MIKRFTIKNFRSLLDVSVDLADITVLAGRSGTGKTNFVDAISLLSTLIVHGSHPNNVSHPLMRFGGSEAFRPANMKRGEFNVEFSVLFSIPGYSDDFEYTLITRFPNFFVQEERLSHAGQIIFHQKADKWIQEPKLKGVGTLGTVMLGWLTGLPEANVAHISLAKSISDYNFPGTVLASSGIPAPTGPEPLHSDGANAIRVIDGIVGSIQTLPRLHDIESALKILSPSLVAITVTPFSNSRVAASYQLGEEIISIDLPRQSEGFRRFLAHLIAIYQNPTPQVILFEEPEKGIFPGALSLLADHIKSASLKLGTQFILTTHSPQLLDAFRGEAIRWVKFSAQGTQIAPLAPDDLLALRDGLMTPGEFLTVTDPGQPEPIQG
ncbi:MAG: AAA family ATPase [Phycisphaerae bacterium]